jgi:formylmethanofuran dehydrogenase subunit E
MTTLDEVLTRLKSMHDHLCPRQVLGARAGMLAAEQFGLAVPQTDKRLFAFVEIDGCFADGLAVASGCCIGHRTMRVQDYGKVAATVVDTESGRAVRIRPHPQARVRAWHYAADGRDHWHAMLAAYQIMPACELLEAKTVRLTVALEQIISREGLRAGCARCGEEIFNEREVRIEGDALCRACAGAAYYYLLD